MPTARNLTLLLALTCGTMAVACASASVPTELLGTLDPSAAGTAPTLEFDVRVGENWLEVRARNVGQRTALIDWAGASFVTANGRRHRLLSGALLTELDLALQQEEWVRQGWVVPWHPTQGAAASRERVEDRLHRAPPAEWRTRLSAGRSRSVLVYPLEHIRRDGERYSVAALFCTLDDPAEGHRFELEIPVLSAGRWDTHSLAFRTLPRLAASR